MTRAHRSRPGAADWRSRSREAKISFDVGQGTQDLGFRSDVDIRQR